MHDDGNVKFQNWIIIFAGIIIFALGFIVLALVGDNYSGFMGFLSNFLILFGTIVISIGFYINFRAKKNDQDENNTTQES